VPKVLPLVRLPVLLRLLLALQLVPLHPPVRHRKLSPRLLTEGTTRPFTLRWSCFAMTKTCFEDSCKKTGSIPTWKRVGVCNTVDLSSSNNVFKLPCHPLFNWDWEFTLDTLEINFVASPSFEGSGEQLRNGVTLDDWDSGGAKSSNLVTLLLLGNSRMKVDPKDDNLMRFRDEVGHTVRPGYVPWSCRDTLNGSPLNFLPQSKASNTGAWHAVEEVLHNIIKSNACDCAVTIEFTYDADTWTSAEKKAFWQACMDAFVDPDSPTHKPTAFERYNALHAYSTQSMCWLKDSSASSAIDVCKQPVDDKKLKIRVQSLTSRLSALQCSGRVHADE
jgi:hypothetical protein